MTGASRGIGAAIAAALAARGAHVVLVARDSSALEQVEQAIHDAGGSATIAPLDLTDGDSIARLAQAVSERWQSLDMLVLNAATLGPLTPVQDIGGKDYSAVLTLNVLAQQAMIAGFDALLRASDASRIVALTSSVATHPRAFWGAYASSKAALEVLLDCYGAENERTGGPRVAIVDPARTRTKMRAEAYPGEDPAAVKPPGEVGEAVADLLARDFPSGERLKL